MRTIAIADINDGMILLEPVMGNSGQIILSQGTTLTKSLARRLESRGIMQITIEGDDGPSAGSDTGSVPEHSNHDTLDKRFSKKTNSLTMNTIYAAVKNHVLGTENGEHNE
ncbi:MAG: hypothetical protein OCC49_06450 [Fibrobacterales bacterium]